MGLATITENLGEGLYRVKLQYDQTALERELAALNTAEDAYLLLVAKAIDTRDQLENDTILARDAVNAVIQQWQDALIKRGQEQPGELVPDDPTDPETGLPWEDPDRAQEAPLLAAINAARTATGVGTVSRDSDLDAACLAHLRYQKRTGQIGHIGISGSKARDRAGWAGYANPATLNEVLAYGLRTPATASAKMLSSDPDALLDDAVTKAGVAHVYAASHVSSYLWAVILASNEGAASEVVVEEDPAKKAAEDAEQSLGGVPKPEIDTLKPEKLGEVVKKFALAKQKYLAAEREVERLMAEKLIRLQRIADLEDLQDAMAEEFDVWACQCVVDLEIGSTVQTAEVPGFWQSDQTTNRYSTFGLRNDPYEQFPDYEVPYTERRFNLIPSGLCESGKLKYAEVMTDSSIFFNAAIEPGHLKWKPLWRYGTITSLIGDSCNLTLESLPCRSIRTRPVENLLLDETLTLTNVNINYPPCNGAVFEIDDEVLVLFTGHNREAPQVIGFRREPTPCPGGRTSWTQIR